MKSYPAKPKVSKFDKSKLTDSDYELLRDYKKRRKGFDNSIEESNIIYHKKTCPGCGFPTFETDNKYTYTTCSICLWEGYTSNKHDTYEGPPNYISLVVHRINFSSQLKLFLKTNEIDNSVDKIIRSIRLFEQSEIRIDRENFDNNLKNILPTKPKQY